MNRLYGPAQPSQLSSQLVRPASGISPILYLWPSRRLQLNSCFSVCEAQKSLALLPSDQYCEEKVRAWKEEIERLSEIAKSQPHAAYIAFTKGYKSKFTYFMRTIESFEVCVDPIQEVIEDLLLPTLFGQSEPLPNEVRRLATLATG